MILHSRSRRHRHARPSEFDVTVEVPDHKALWVRMSYRHVRQLGAPAVAARSALVSALRIAVL